MWPLFFIAGVPIVFAMLVWVIVTAFRVLRPEEGIPLDQDPEILHRRRLRSGRAVDVRFQDIRLIERERVHANGAGRAYTYDTGYSTGVPTAWAEDLEERRN